MLVYRLEVNKRGPYSRKEAKNLGCLPLIERLCDCHSNMSRPSWNEDYDLSLDENYKSGCLSIDQLKEWFEGFFEDLLSVGFQVFKYEVKEYLVGESNKQVVFIPNDDGEFVFGNNRP